MPIKVPSFLKWKINENIEKSQSLWFSFTWLSIISQFWLAVMSKFSNIWRINFFSSRILLQQRIRCFHETQINDAFIYCPWLFEQLKFMIYTSHNHNFLYITNETISLPNKKNNKEKNPRMRGMRKQQNFHASTPFPSIFHW